MGLFDFKPPRDFADHALRHALGDPRDLREIVAAVLPAAVADRLRFEEADYLKPDFLLEDWRGREADILALVPYEAGTRTSTRWVRGFG